MEMILRNRRPSSVVLFSVDSDNQEREQGEVPPGASMFFWAPPGTELRIKDFDTKASIHREIVNPPGGRAVREEEGIEVSWTEAVALSGVWIYRSFNPAYVTGDKISQKERELILADDVVLTLRNPPDRLEGTIEWPGGGLNLSGTVVSGQHSRFDIVGTGRPGTGTAGWEYRYHGIKRPWLAQGVDQPPTIVGSVMRAKPHNGQPGAWQRPAGYVGSFIAVKQPPDWASGLPGSWTYRSFHNNPESDLSPQKTRPTTDDLILQGANFALGTPTSTTLQGEIVWEGGSLGLEGTVSPGADGEPARFEIVGTGYPSTGTRGWEYRYYGHLMRDWPNGIDQRPALVGSVIRVKPHDDAPAGYVAPFIAVKRSLPFNWPN